MRLVSNTGGTRDGAREHRAAPPRRLRSAVAAWSAVAGALAVAAVARAEQDTGSPEARAQRIATRVCQVSEPEQWFAGPVSPGELEHEPIVVRGEPIGERVRWRAPDLLWTVQRVAPGGVLRRVRVSLERAEGATPGPVVEVVTDADCRVIGGRRMRYDDADGDVVIEHLDARLAPTGVVESLNPPVPPGTDPGGVAVALVDAGVNYLLDDVAAALARDRSGNILGYDFWDMDTRPFDANPSQSPFYPRRHGTRTATLLLAEAPVTRIVPYRYPRPDMSRMRRVVEEAAAHGVRIVNLSLGGNDAAEWNVFAEAAARHPHILFVASAGNNGRDIDVEPVYPASLALDNLITATSAGDDRRPAVGSNWGRRSVDVLVPAEQMIVTGFDGHARLASGSSYAAIRVSALAACLLAARPQWGARELKDAIFARLERSPMINEFVAGGFLPDPTDVDRGGCRAEPDRVEVVEEVALSAVASAPSEHVLEPTFVVVRDSGWSVDAAAAAIDEARGILRQCGIGFGAAAETVHVVAGPQRVRYYHRATASELADALPLSRPTVFFLKDTLARIEFGAESIGRANSGGRPWLENTVWLTAGVADPGISLAHELFHVLADSGHHVDEGGNLMRDFTRPGATELTAAQCASAVETAAANRLLHPPN